MANTTELRDTSWIQKTSDVCGGAACVRNFRIPVWLLVEGRQVGMSDEALLAAHPDLNQADLDAAWAYFSANRDEIDGEIKANNEA
jgi:uncharacterized protein (DUF433 family)